MHKHNTCEKSFSLFLDVTPVGYLKKYCIVTETQEFLYTKCFGTMHAGTMIKPRVSTALLLFIPIHW